MKRCSQFTAYNACYVNSKVLCFCINILFFTPLKPLDSFFFVFLRKHTQANSTLLQIVLKNTLKIASYMHVCVVTLHAFREIGHFFLAT